MRRPPPDELLRGVHEGLTDSVLPAVDDPAATRQLKAALHVLRRLERCWDRMPAYLAADNADLRDTLRRVAQMLGDEDPSAEPTLGGDADPGAANDRLQSTLADVDARVRDGAGLDATLRATVLAVLAELYDRMIDREAHAWGTTP